MLGKGGTGWLFRGFRERIMGRGSNNLTMRSSGLRGHTIVFPDVVSARSRLTRR
jgi:hypothetical protein